MTSTPITTADIAKGKIDDALSVREKIGYGLGDAGGTVITCLIMNFLTFFYTDVFGLTPALVGTLFIALRVFDAISDPVMGVIADRTQSRWGRFRPPPNQLSVSLLCRYFQGSVTCRLAISTRCVRC